MTFKKGSIIDVTIASPLTASEWAVLNELSLTDHYFIIFDVEYSSTSTNSSIPRKKINLQELEAALLSNQLDIDTSSMKAEECANNLITKIHTKCTLNLLPSSRRKSVYWWSSHISDLRKKANHLQRVHQWVRKRLGLTNSLQQEQDAKEAKHLLVTAIKKAKDNAWMKLCDMVETEPWECHIN